MVDLSIQREAARAGQHDRVRDHANVGQTGAAEQRVELPADPRIRDGGVENLGDAPRQRLIGGVDDGLV